MSEFTKSDQGQDGFPIRSSALRHGPRLVEIPCNPVPGPDGASQFPPVSTFHLAQYNIAWIVAPLDSPAMADFTDNIVAINQLAEQAPGFVWRHQTEDGDSTSIRIRDDDRIIINFSVWQDAESLFQFAFYSGHADYYRRRNEWFTHEDEPYAVLWWVPAGHAPTVEEAEAKLAELKRNGVSQAAFTFKKRFPEPDER